MLERRRFPNEKPAQVNYQRFLRVGEVIAVDFRAGTCRVNWYDVPGQRQDVILTQATEGEFHVPAIGSAVVCGFDAASQAIVLRCIPKEWVVRAKPISEGGKESLPPMEFGEKYMESTTRDGRKSYLYMSRTGNIEMESGFGVRMGIEDISQTAYLETRNSRTLTDNLTIFSGKVKRLIGNALLYISRTVGTGIAVTTKYLTETKIKVFEYANDAVTFGPLQTPLVQLTLGTVVTDQGALVNKLGIPTIDLSKEVAVQLELPGNTKLYIDKSGRATITGLRLNINNGSVDATDPDIAQGLESNNVTLGTKGQHVAREHDEVTVPLAPDYADPAHQGLSEKALTNQAALVALASSIFTFVGPCFYIGNLPPQTKLTGEVTEGAQNVHVGG